jgi:hypothetical protein
VLRLLLKLALAAAALAAVWSWVPLGERTLADRWRAAATPGAFLDRTLAELVRAGAGGRPVPRPQPRSQPGARPDGRPEEAHSDADRKALDRILSDRLDEPPARR